MGEAQLAQQSDRGLSAFLLLADPDRQGRPLADSVGGEDRGAAAGCGQEGGGGVRLMVAGEEDLVRRHAELRRDHPTYPQLLAEHVLHRLGEGAP